MKILIANDHAAVDLKMEVKAYLEGLGHEIVDVGAMEKKSCHYPEIGARAGRMIAAGEADCGVLMCGTGAGIAMAANKIKGIRAVACSEPVTARLAKEHNHANIIAFGERIIGVEMAKAILDAWLNAECLEGRHQLRADMLDAL
ncbi:MAG: ribose 5-phosphate isomerase B [Clostridiales bacterium]|nr:ribose 5-phosphate isomerase B [Clostridiales bacterium]